MTTTSDDGPGAGAEAGPAGVGQAGLQAGPEDGRALVVIDMQVVFADPQSPWATGGFAAITPVVARLAERFTPRVVFTRFVAPEKPSGAWVHYYEQWPFALQPDHAPLWDVIPELDSTGYQVVSAPSFGKWGPALSDALDGATGIVLCGVSTDCCVLSTALAAADAGMPVEVVADACAGLSQIDHQRALDAMALYAPLITVVATAELG